MKKEYWYQAREKDGTTYQITVHTKNKPLKLARRQLIDRLVKRYGIEIAVNMVYSGKIRLEYLGQVVYENEVIKL